MAQVLALGMGGACGRLGSLLRRRLGRRLQCMALAALRKISTLLHGYRERNGHGDNVTKKIQVLVLLRGLG